MYELLVHCGSDDDEEDVDDIVDAVDDGFGAVDDGSGFTDADCGCVEDELPLSAGSETLQPESAAAAQIITAADNVVKILFFNVFPP